mmetsp:Transcript_82217/g.129440  ORF Transcript_82217/g.129440 Transcript_82217/m.129440 type:complete len:489 (-) Transcript_82217:138-1604(-)
MSFAAEQGKPHQGDDLLRVCHQIASIRQGLSFLQQDLSVVSDRPTLADLACQHIGAAARDDRECGALAWRDTLAELRKVDLCATSETRLHDVEAPCRAETTCVKHDPVAAALASAKEATIALNAPRSNQIVFKRQEDGNHQSICFSVAASSGHASPVQSYRSNGSVTLPVSLQPWAQVDALADQVARWPSDKQASASSGDLLAAGNLAHTFGRERDSASPRCEHSNLMAALVRPDCYSNDNSSMVLESCTDVIRSQQDRTRRSSNASSSDCKSVQHQDSILNRSSEEGGHSTTTSRIHAASAPSSPRSRSFHLPQRIAGVGAHTKRQSIDGDIAARTFQSFSERSPQPRDCALGIGPASHCQHDIEARTRSRSQGRIGDVVCSGYRQIVSEIRSDALVRMHTVPIRGVGHIPTPCRNDRLESFKQASDHLRLTRPAQRSQSSGGVPLHFAAAETFAAFRERSPEPRDRGSLGAHVAARTARSEFIPVK